MMHHYELFEYLIGIIMGLVPSAAVTASTLLLEFKMVFGYLLLCALTVIRPSHGAAGQVYTSLFLPYTASPDQLAPPSYITDCSVEHNVSFVHIEITNNQSGIV